MTTRTSIDVTEEEVRSLAFRRQKSQQFQKDDEEQNVAQAECMIEITDEVPAQKMKFGRSEETRHFLRSTGIKLVLSLCLVDLWLPTQCLAMMKLLNPPSRVWRCSTRSR